MRNLIRKILLTEVKYNPTGDKKPKVGDYLYATKPIDIEGYTNYRATTEGKAYKITDVRRDGTIVFRNDDNQQHELLTPDFFNQYFILVSKEEYDSTSNTEDVFNSLYESEEDIKFPKYSVVLFDQTATEENLITVNSFLKEQGYNGLNLSILNDCFKSIMNHGGSVFYLEPYFQLTYSGMKYYRNTESKKHRYNEIDYRDIVSTLNTNVFDQLNENDDLEWAQDSVESVKNIDLSNVEDLNQLNPNKDYLIWVEDLNPHLVGKIFEFIGEQGRWFNYKERGDFNEIVNRCSIIILHRIHGGHGRGGISVYTHDVYQSQRNRYEEIKRGDRHIEINPYHILAQM